MPDSHPDEIALFTAASQLSGDARDAFLEKACRGDRELRERIEGYLRWDNKIGPLDEGPPAISAVVNEIATTDFFRTGLGPYTLLKQLGRGTMGVVYEAEEVSLGRRVALKVLPFAALLNQTQLERFNTEATAAARLQHTGIVQIYSVGCERGIHFYAMQLIDGPSLAEVIAELQSVGKQQQEPADTVVTRQTNLLTRDEDGGHYRAVARFGKEAAEALDYAHRNGVLHRDIKPSNLLLDKTGHVWIADFGLARVEDESQLTRTGDILGTLRYMSPEQAAGDRVDARTDVYSLGATLHELATLQPVLDAKDRRDIIKQVLAGHSRAPHKLESRIPEPLSLVISKAMARLDERYQSAQELADDLRRFLDGEPVHARPPSPLRRARAALQRHPIITVFSIVVLIVAFLSIAQIASQFGRKNASSAHQSSDPDAETQKKGSVSKLLNIPINDETSPVDHPKGITRSPDGDFFVTSKTNTILQYDGMTFQFKGTFVGSGSGGLDGPVDLVFGEGDLFVSSENTNSVLRYNGEDGTYLGEFVPSGAHGIEQPKDLLVHEGSLYVSAWSRDVHRYSITTGEFLGKFVETGEGGIQLPAGISFGPDGNFYVADFAASKVKRYHGTTGRFMDDFVRARSGGLDGAVGIRFGPDGNLYVVSGRNDSVLRYRSESGEFIDVFVSQGQAGIAGPTRLLFSGERLLVTSRYANQIMQFEVKASR